MNWMGWVCVAIGGAGGSLARVYLSQIMERVLGSVFPYGTLIVNLIGCLLVGLLFSYPKLSSELRLLLISGFLGGFTTFSAYQLDTVGLLQSGMSGKTLLYQALSVFGGFSLVYLGLWLGPRHFHHLLDQLLP